jgi:hypothetical protein
VSGPGWQRGYPLEELKQQTQRFTSYGRRYAFGAFALPNERDIAEARAQAELCEGPGAALLFHKLRHGSRRRDFAGHEAALQPGDVLVRALAFAWEPGAVLKLFEALPPGPALWVEAFEEDRQLTAALMAHGFVYVGTRIGAGSEVKGLYLRAREEERAVRVPLALASAADRATLVRLRAGFFSPDEVTQACVELGAYLGRGPAWQQHYSSYNKRHSWSAFALVGFSEDPGFIIKPSEMSRQWRMEHGGLLAQRPRETEAAASFPVLLALLRDRLPGAPRFERLRFMRLTPSGELSRHADVTNREAGTRIGQVARLHLPLITSASVDFVAWSARGERLAHHLEPGDLWYLDQRKPHCVQNRDPARERVHVVMDVFVTPEIRAWLAATQEVAPMSVDDHVHALAERFIPPSEPEPHRSDRVNELADLLQRTIESFLEAEADADEEGGEAAP